MIVYRPLSLKVNYIVGFCEVLVTSACLFIVYRIVSLRLGLEPLGLWATLAGTIAVARSFDLGLVPTITAFASSKRFDFSVANVVPMFAFVSCYAFIIGALAYGASHFLVCFLVPSEQLELARKILMILSISLVLQLINNVFFGISFSQHAGYLKSASVIVAQIINLSIVVALIDDLGIEALARGQALGLSFIFVLGVSALLASMQWDGGRKPWSLFEFGRTLLYHGSSFQILSLINAPFEPILRILVGQILGFHALGLFEIIQRSLIQLKTLFVAPAQNLQRYFMEDEGDKFANVFTAYSVFTLFYILAGIPLSIFMGFFVAGELSATFLTAHLFISLGWGSSLLATPFWMYAASQLRLRGNLLGATCTVLFGLMGPALVGAFSPGLVQVSFAAAIGIVIGSIATIVTNAHLFRLSYDIRLAAVLRQIKEKINKKR